MSEVTGGPRADLEEGAARGRGCLKTSDIETGASPRAGIRR